jgi:hypothetical protein
VEFYQALAVTVPDPESWWCPALAEAVDLADAMAERQRVQALSQ